MPPNPKKSMIAQPSPLPVCIMGQTEKGVPDWRSFMVARISCFCPIGEPVCRGGIRRLSKRRSEFMGRRAGKGAVSYEVFGEHHNTIGHAQNREKGLDKYPWGVYSEEKYPLGVLRPLRKAGQ